ncbi:Membrane protein involved in the export of O-antigen and teichoic acid [Gracilibacillus ureilyticus]|uniref:Membrane protein involved in the export of O-antigen and teichoic acid n=1 Tax=Gracilibacillus ureilyticus TaxID=531814 RepID=A0A1H9RCL3_9BACI|nr:polysaccharide biosynthesis protein [Gracilibacillus ureilyticus]SER70285.1 Membrane protein involved in the export of O-antigen and teichoic acid [Gracilibacillus ureilyticus]
MSASTFVKSTLILTIATLLSKVLGSVFRIPLQNIAGDEVLGIFSLVYPVYMVALILSVAGLPLAISKLIAEAHTKQDKRSIREIYITASILAILFGIVSFSLIFLFSEYIANAIGGPSTRIALIVVAGTLLVAPYMAVYRGYFQGTGDMKPTALSQVLEQFVRVGLILVIAYYLVEQGYSDEIIAGGVMAGSIIGALASLLYLRVKYHRAHIEIPEGHQYSLPLFKKWMKVILSISIPIAIGSLTMALFNMVDSVTVTYGLRVSGVSTDEVNYLYGIYGRGLTVVQIATVFATSIVLPLVPLITQKLTNKDSEGTRNIIEKTYRMTHLISWPAAAGLLVLTAPLNLGLFTNMEDNTMLAIINASSVFTSFTLLGTGILQGMNLARTAAFIILGGVVLKTVANTLFVQWYGLNGAAWATMLVYIVIFIINTIIIYRHIPFRLFDKNVMKILFSAVVMGAVIGTPLYFFEAGEMTRLAAMGYVMVAIAIGAVIYGGLLILLKAVNLAELPVIGKRFKKK